MAVASSLHGITSAENGVFWLNLHFILLGMWNGKQTWKILPSICITLTWYQICSQPSKSDNVPVWGYHTSMNYCIHLFGCPRCMSKAWRNMGDLTFSGWSRSRKNSAAWWDIPCSFVYTRTVRWQHLSSHHDLWVWVDQTLTIDTIETCGHCKAWTAWKFPCYFQIWHH